MADSVIATPAEFVAGWQAEVKAALRDTFVRHAIDNRGVLSSTRRTTQVVDQLYDLVSDFLSGRISQAEVAEATLQLAGQGLALISGTALLRALHNALNVSAVEPADLRQALHRKLNDFQLSFLENLATAREAIRHQATENSQAALQGALHRQLEQQQELRQLQERRSESLRRILQLNATLARITEENLLLDEAVSGICRSLDLADVTIYQFRDGQWSIRTTTAADLKPGQAIPANTLRLLETVAQTGEDVVQQSDDGQNIRVVVPLLAGDQLFGAVAANGASHLEDVPILIRAFTLNLAALWQNLSLFVETREHAREMEVLYGRYVDSVWQSQTTALHARYDAGHFQASRESGGDEGGQNGRGDDHTIPLVIGDSPFGQVVLPEELLLSHEDSDFVQALVREMGNALNNAQLLQVTRSYSNQLQVAADVSRAASTILDRNRLIQEVVELIRERFDLYYVGLFLVNESDEAALQAGTGEAGRIQVDSGHKLPVGGHSMIGQAIARDEARVEQDVRQAAAWQPNPHLPDTRSELALPLRTRGRTIGALTVQSVHVAAFTAEVITVLQTLADQLATAIENASLFAQIQENLAETNRLYRAGRRISEASNALMVFQVLVDFAAESGICDLAHVIAPDPISPEYLVSPVLWSRHETDFNPTDRFPRDKFPFSNLLAQNELIIIRDGQADETLDPATRGLFKRNHVRGAALIPIHIENRWLATLIVDRVEANPPSQQELQPFLTLADQAAVILANQILLTETEALYGVSRALNEAITRDDALQITLGELVLYTGLEQCYIVLYDKVAGYGLVALANKPVEGLGELRLPMSGDPTYEQLPTRQALVVEDDGSDPPSEAALHYLRPFGLRAALLIPAISQQELIGFLALGTYGRTDRFTQSNINFAQTVADQFTTTVESIKLFDEALERARKLIALNQIGARISGTLDLDELALVVYEQVGLLLDNTFFSLRLYDKESREYRPLLAVHKGEFLEVEPRVLADDEPLYRLLAGGQPLLADSSSALDQAETEWLASQNGRRPQSLLWVPIMQETIPTGLLSVYSYEPHAYSDNDVQLLRSIATQTGLAISNAQLFAETQERVAEWRLLFSISQAAASSIDANERIENVVEALYNNLSGADVALMIANEAAQQLETIAARGLHRHPPVIPFSYGLAGQVARLGQPLLVNDLRELPELSQDSRVLSQLVVPLNLGGRTIGVINVQSRQADTFTDKDLRLLQTLSVSLAATIQTGRLFQEIQDANERLRELDRLKTQFLANMSHELRTPLNSIIGFSRVILKGIDGPTTPEQEEDLTSIHNSGQHLLRLINDILDLAKIEAGKMALAFEIVDLQEMAESVMSTARGLVKDKDIKLIWDIDSRLPLIEADPIRLRQLLLNFLSNAAKFTEKGFIALHIHQESERCIHISVKDTGIGIAPEDHEKLFAAFEQADSTPTRSYGGTGLGLPISKRLVELHQGEIWFESEVGKGTTFHVRLPISQEENAEALLPDTLEAGGRSDPAGSQEQQPNGQPAILVVDDEPGIIGLYERYLRAQPYRVIGANSGQEALQALRHNKGQIQLVLLDINMPDLTGWDVLKAIRDNPEVAEIPVVICSIENNPAKAAALGAQLSLLKPIVEDDLLQALHQLGVRA
ncbi:MAG: GAF domain-containing protein [Chloroflexi bacterium]|nr:GAF domain-containing protein [Chloroflexota bacterium]MCI0579045.1 GAF domain-containing protein [Chloroflexota bacterium]MCI0644623.1 GAF domain-containing protein [Chloroflexota bacterium]MCI0727628.1 GAF domain-containing protein [Chloroflexota bacterium]